MRCYFILKYYYYGSTTTTHLISIHKILLWMNWITIYRVLIHYDGIKWS